MLPAGRPRRCVGAGGGGGQGGRQGLCPVVAPPPARALLLGQGLLVGAGGGEVRGGGGLERKLALGRFVRLGAPPALQHGSLGIRPLRAVAGGGRAAIRLLPPVRFCLVGRGGWHDAPPPGAHRGPAAPPGTRFMTGCNRTGGPQAARKPPRPALTFRPPVHAAPCCCVMEARPLAWASHGRSLGRWQPPGG